ncbi:MAG: HDIG domain-containing protein [Phycisphaerales bacterium]
MPKEGSRGPKTGSAKRSRTRRPVVRVRGLTLRQRAARLFDSPSFAWGAMITLVFVVLAGVLVAWAREQPRVSVGRVMMETRTVRVPFTMVDAQQTERDREAARQRTPRVYTAVPSVLDEIGNSLRALPKTLAGVEGAGGVAPDIRSAYALDDEKVRALQDFSTDDDAYQVWTGRVDALMGFLREHPLLDAQTWQRALQETLSSQIELRMDAGHSFVDKNNAVNISDAQSLRTEIAKLVKIAGFVGPPAQVIEHRLTAGATPTFIFDAEATGRAQQASATGVPDVFTPYPVGQRIYERGDVLSQQQMDVYSAERAAFYDNASFWLLWSRRVGAFVAVGLLSVVLAGYLGTFCPRVANRPPRMGWMAGLIVVALGVSLIGTILDPRLVMLSAIAPTLLVAVLIAIAYDQRTALAVGGALALLVALGLQMPTDRLSLLVLGIAAAVWRLNELRDRRALVSLSLTLGATLLVASLTLAAIDRPMTRPDWHPWAMQTLRDAALAGFGGMLVGGVTLFILPVVERVFDITTGMTLIELRDPKQPLLREMLQRAPGTYNHSLNVASIAETAADAIGADSLLTYVGALYHDIGKINKPEYFVENQSGGPNKHDKLAPAMSLLVIVGHVKDGIAMAREHGLPRNIQHFIDAHHGTTLVEYFYKRARKQAIGVDDMGKTRPSTGEPAVEIEGERLPEEVDYRYPGPKPQTKEVAILMLADAVESATRTLAEPTPARIDALVRDLANRRLMDGQFDECDLTLRELRAIVESISKTVASIYHGRISYSDDKKSESRRGAKDEPTGEARERRA